MSDFSSFDVPKLQREADRLLTALAEPGVTLTMDHHATKPRLLLSIRKAAVSISRGAFSLEAARVLASQGAIIWQEGDKPVAQIIDAGRARLRRNAPSSDVEAEIAPFTRQQMSLVVEILDEKKEKNPCVRDASESPLAWLARRKGRDGKALISVIQFEAGERLRRDLTFAAMLPRTTANWGAVGGNQCRAPTLNHSEMVLAARQRVQKALTNVGPEFSGLLTDICGFLKGLEQIERERDWPPRSGKVVLGMALDRLAAHYGLREAAQGPASAKLRHWGAPDYRPTI